jgi:glucose-1-phosphate cytidylyltransferase
MQTVVLCGGKGTRLGPAFENVPKPLLPVGDHPILWHILKIYGAQGFRDFLLCVGHLGERFVDYFADPPESAREWRVRVLDTGSETPTGGRVKQVEAHVGGDEFFVTYGDGLADIDLHALVAFHRSHGKAATLTAARPRNAFGIVGLADDGRVESFEEKPVMRDWVNGGFFVFGRRVFDYLEEDSVLEREPFERLAADGELMAFRHDGFWTCMDTYKDNLVLTEAWEHGSAPWKLWPE